MSGSFTLNSSIKRTDLAKDDLVRVIKDFSSTEGKYPPFDFYAKVLEVKDDSIVFTMDDGIELNVPNDVMDNGVVQRLEEITNESK